MEDREFFDELYAQWARTTGAESMFWMPEEVGSDEQGPLFNLYAIAVDAEGNQEKKLVASYLRELDVDFIAGVHGCLADLIRRLHTAIDESDRLDEHVDVQERRIADLEREVAALHEENQRILAMTDREDR